MIMLDDFFIRALLAGIGVALIAGPLGCVIVWRRLSYFGDTLSHAALLGVALAALLNLNNMLVVFLVSVAVAILLLVLQKKLAVPSDALLGILSHGFLALGLVVLSLMTWLRVDLMSLLFGDVLAVTRSDLALIYGAGLVLLLVLASQWRYLFATTVSEDLAAVEGVPVERTNFIFMVLLAVVVAVAMKIVGVLLITALLIIPAATARGLSSGPEQMAFLAAMIGCLCVVFGLFGSLHFDTPSGPSIVVAAMALFVVSLTPLRGLLSFLSRKH